MHWGSVWCHSSYVGVRTCKVVIVCPYFLQADDVGCGLRGGQLLANLSESCLTLFGDVELEAPAVQSDDVDF